MGFADSHRTESKQYHSLKPLEIVLARNEDPGPAKSRILLEFGEDTDVSHEGSCHEMCHTLACGYTESLFAHHWLEAAHHYLLGGGVEGGWWCNMLLFTVNEGETKLLGDIYHMAVKEFSSVSWFTQQAS